MNGWLKLHRKITDSNMYKSLNAAQRDVMMQCLILANHEPNKWEWKGQIFTCQPGQFITSLESLKARCANDVTTKMVRTALIKLEKWDFLANDGARTGRVITVMNWHTYQVDQEAEGKPSGRIGANSGQTAGKQRATKEEDKKAKEMTVEVLLASLPSCKTEASLKKYMADNKKFVNSLFEKDQKEVIAEFSKRKVEITELGGSSQAQRGE